MAIRKPRPGSLPRLKVDESAEPEPLRWAQSAWPPFMTEEEIEQAKREKERRAREYVLTALGAARKKAEQLAGELRNDAFADWVRRCVVKAQVPAEWTQARSLYASYIDHAKTYGRNRAQRALAVQELATETQWGRMMATQFPKKRRPAGVYYPLRLKRNG